MSSSFSATSRFSRAFSFSSSLIRRTASRSTAPYSARHRCSVTADTPSDLATSAIGVPLAGPRQPASAWRPPPRDGDASCSNASSGDSSRPLGPQKSLIRGGPVQRTPVIYIHIQVLPHLSRPLFSLEARSGRSSDGAGCNQRHAGAGCEGPAGSPDGCEKLQTRRAKRELCLMRSGYRVTRRVNDHEEV